MLSRSQPPTTTLYIYKRKAKLMKKETKDLIDLISNSDDPNKAALTAFAILLEYFEKREKEIPVQLLVDCKGTPT